MCISWYLLGLPQAADVIQIIARNTCTCIWYLEEVFLDYPLSLLSEAITFVHFCSRAPSGQPPGGTQAVMIIGNNNVFEVGSCILFLLKDCILWKIDLKPETLSVMTSYLTSVQCHDTVVHVMSWHCILFYTTFWAF